MRHFTLFDKVKSSKRQTNIERTYNDEKEWKTSFIFRRYIYYAYFITHIAEVQEILKTQGWGRKSPKRVPKLGKWYTNENIDQMLMERHLNKKARRASGKNHLKGPRKRTSEDDEHFRESFERMIHMAMDKEN